MEAVKPRHKTKKPKVKPVAEPEPEVEPEPETEPEPEQNDNSQVNASEEVKDTEGDAATSNEKEQEKGEASTEEEKETDGTAQPSLNHFKQSQAGTASNSFEGMEDEDNEANTKYTDNFEVPAYSNLTQQQTQQQEQQQQQQEQQQNILTHKGRELSLVQKELLNVSQIVKENEKMEKDNNGERWNDMPGDLETSHFYQLVKGYRSEQLAYRAQCMTFDAVLQDIYATVQNKLWNFRSCAKSSSKRCSCGKLLEVNAEEMVAELDQQQYSRLHTSTKNAADRLNEGFLMLNKVYFSSLKISRYISRFFATSENFSQITPAEPVIAVMLSQQTPKLAEEVTQLRHMLNVLFFFERNRPEGLDKSSKKLKDQPIIAFHKDVEEWILSLGSALLRRASFDDHMFLLQHLLCCPNISQWDGASLVQFPDVWDDMVASHFVNVAMALVRPVFRGNKCRQCIEEVRDWMDYEDAEQDRNRKFQISEVDLMSIFEQVQVGPFCNYLLDNHGTEYANDIVINLLKALCTSLFNLRVYKEFTKLVIRMIVVLLSVVAKADFNSGQGLSFNVTQEQFDAFVMTTSYFIISLREPSFWQFVSELPLDSLSHEGVWQFMGMIHFLPILRLPQTWDEWDVVDWNLVSNDTSTQTGATPEDFDEDSMPLDNLAKVCTENTCEGVFVFDTLAYLARLREEDVAQTCISTLFHIGFIDERSKGVMMSEAILKLSFLCESKGQSIGYLLRLVFNYIDYVNKEKEIQTFIEKKLPLDTWIPDYDSLDFIARELVKNPKNEYAQMIMKRIRWGSEEVSLSINRFGALQVLELLDWYQKKKSESSLFDISTPSLMKDGIVWCKKQLKMFQYFKLEDPEQFPEKYRSIGSGVLNDAVQHVKGLKPKKNWNKMSNVYILAYFLLTEHENAVEEWCSQDQPALKELLEPMESAYAVFLLSQIVPILICKSGENFMRVITPGFVSTVFKKIADVGNLSTTLTLLIAEPIKLLEKNNANATMLADFWVRCATFSDGWTSNANSLAVIEATLNAYFCFITKEVPAPFFTQKVIDCLTKREASQKIVILSVMPTSNIKSSPVTNYPLTATSTLIAELNYLIVNMKLRNFSDYFVKVEQFINYGIEFSAESEFNIIFWQVTINVFFQALINQQDQRVLTILQSCGGSMIVKLMRLGEICSKKEASDTVEEIKAKFFFGAAALLQGAQGSPQSFGQVVYNVGPDSQYIQDNDILLTNADPARHVCEVMQNLLVELVNISKVPSYTTVVAMTEIRKPALPKYLQFSEGISKYDAVIKKFAVNLSALVPMPYLPQRIQQIGIYDKDMLQRVNAVTENIKRYSKLENDKYNKEKSYIIEYVTTASNMYVTVERTKQEAKRCTSCGRTIFLELSLRNSEFTEVKTRMDAITKELENLVASESRRIEFYIDMYTLSNVAGEMMRTLKAILDGGFKGKEKENNAFAEGVCGPLFQILFETWEDMSVNWFVGRNFHPVMLSATDYLSKFPKEACRLLDFFLARPDRIRFAVQAFQPCKDRRTFCTLLSKLLSAPSILVPENDKLFQAFLPCFDVAMWLTLDPTIEERCAVLDVVCNGLAAPFTIPTIREFLVESFKLLVEYDLCNTIGHVIVTLFNAGAGRIALTLWETIDKTLLGQQLTFDGAVASLGAVISGVDALCAQGRPIFGQWCQWFNSFFPTIINIALQKIPHAENAVMPLVACIFGLYKIILGTTLTERNNSLEVKMAAMMADLFAETIKRLQVSGAYPHAIGDLWYFLTKDLQLLTPGTSVSFYMQNIVCTSIRVAPWDRWCPGMNDLETIRDVLTTYKESGGWNMTPPGVIELALHIFVTVPWDNFGYFHTKEFSELVLQICIYALLLGPTKYDDKPEEIMGRCIRMPWELVSVGAYSDVLSLASFDLGAIRGDNAMSTKKTLIVFSVLRFVCGLKSENEVIPEEVINPRRDPAKIALFSETLVRLPTLGIFGSSNIASSVFTSMVNSILDTTDIVIRTRAATDPKAIELSSKALVALFTLYNSQPLGQIVCDCIIGFLTRCQPAVPNFIAYACQS